MSLIILLFISIFWFFVFICYLPMRFIDFVEKKILIKREVRTPNTGAIIGILERTIVFLYVILRYCVAWKISLDLITGSFHLMLGLFGVKGLYRLRTEKHLIDWIIIGTFLSLICGLIISLSLLMVLEFIAR